MPPSTTASAQVITRSVEGPIHTTTYAEIRARALKVAQRLDRDGVRLGDRVATLAWNTWRHLEAWYGIMGIGAIYHTVNPRLFPDQIAWIVNHAEDRVLMTDLTFLPLLEKLADKLPSIERYVRADRRRAHAGDAAQERRALRGVDRRGRRRFRLEDRSTRIPPPACATPPAPPAIPRACVYSHRSNVLHSMMAMAPDAMGVASRDVVLPVVPMFHANCWGLALTSPMDGATLVMPGAKLDGAVDLRTAQRLSRHLHRRGADGVADAAAASRGQRRQAAASQEGGDRRLRLPARDDQDIPGRLRRRGLPRLGHDRDEPARLARLDEARIRQA